MPYCTTGRHFWTQAEDAEKCCHGYRRILVLAPAVEACDHHTPSMQAAGTRYGFRWQACDKEHEQKEHPPCDTP